MTQDPILSTGTTVDIAGKTYTLRRLGLQDVFRVARILGNGVAVIGNANDKYNSVQIAQILIASMTRNEAEVLDLIADLLNVERKLLNDPNVFPMDSMLDIFDALSKHQDLANFLARLTALMGTAPSMTTV
jgi:hypothetical protein